MDLTHEFTVPTSVEETWAHFQDVAAVAECFPGATVTEADAGSFRGSCKVKLGPIALLYQGSGTFVERDETDHRFVVEAKGKDKRGNGTAAANVTLTMADSGGGTDVKVVTDLAITGKPAQFGRGVMQDVSDKLLGQFVACLEQRLATPEPAAETPAAEPRQPVVEPVGTPLPDSVGPTAQPAGPTGPKHAADDALDLGATVLPVLVKSYGKQLLGVLAGLLVLRWLLCRRRRRR